MQPRRAKSSGQLVTQLAGLTDDGARRKFLARHPTLIRPEVVSEMADTVREQVRIDVVQALQLAEAALTIANELNDKESLAKALRAKANTLYAQGENAQAVDLHQQAVALFDALGKTSEVARTLSGSIQPLLLMGEYNRAFAAGERARTIFAGQGNTWRLARLDINVGNIYYRQDRFAEAIACYERAYQGLPAKDDPEGIAVVLTNLATCYISLNDFAKALETHEKARTFSEQHGMPLLRTQAEYNIAYLYFLRGEYSRAIEMYRARRLDFKKIGDSYHLALCNLDLSELYLDLNLPSEAAELAQQAHEGFHKLGNGYEAAKSLAFSAIAAGQQGHAFEALKLFSQSRELFIKEKNRAWPSLIDLYRALVFFNEGRLFEARRLCAEAPEALRSLGLPNKAVLAELLLARIALRMDEVEQAGRHCEAALQKLNDLQIPIMAHAAHLLMGNIHSTRNDRGKAYVSYQAAREALESLRSSLHREELKIAFINNRVEVYENLVELCLDPSGEQRSLEEALGYIEQAKSRSLMDLFGRPARAAPSEQTGQSDLARSIRDLREELNWYYNLIEREQLQPEAPSPDRIGKLQGQARARENDLLRMLHEASESDAEQAGLQTPTSVPITVIRASIPAGTLLVEYFRVRDRILVCLLSRDRLQIVPVTLESRVANALRLLQFQLSKFRLDSQYLSAFQDSLVQATQAHLAELYNELIAPIRAQLNCMHLVFVPHGLLHYVPFHALFDGKSYLVDGFTISYAPSASIYLLCQSREGNSRGSSLVLGIPDSQAPAIADEVQGLTDVLPSAELFIGNEASEDTLRNRGPSSRMIHIATHGYFRQDNPMFSAIRLGGSFLSLYDLYQLRLPVELITLSGCATGLNVVAAGDELIGLARGLLHAGAQSLVLSLWDVHDKSTAEYMRAFYRHLGEGNPKPAALRSATLELRRNYPHPYQWAPFILVGKT